MRKNFKKHNRSINSQLQHALSVCQAFGESKYAYKRSHNNLLGTKIYSVGRMDNLRETAALFAKFMKLHHPEIKNVDDIRLPMVYEWLCYNTQKGKSSWTYRTAMTHRSNIIQVFERAKTVYKSICIDLRKLPPVPDDLRPEIRVVAMTQEDLDALRKSYANRDAKTYGRIAIEITARCGLRVKEVAFLTPQSINLEKRVIEVRKGAKNGKYRDVPIRDEDFEFFADLKAKRANWDYVVSGNRKPNPRSINSSIRREMERIGISNVYPDTTEHSVRKYYAYKCLQELVEKVQAEHPEYTSRDCIEEAWPKVQKWLGHGDNNRRALYRAYVEIPIDHRYECD